MAGFDEYIAEVTALVDRLEAAGREVVRSAPAPSSAIGSLPVRVGPGANPGIILRSDTYAELGSPEAGSCGLVLWTDDPTRVCDGRITRVGPDVAGRPGASLPFAQIVIAAGRSLTADDHSNVVQSQVVADQIEGFMVRSSSANLWCRISKDAAAKGFCLETLGRALMQIVRAGIPAIDAVEVVFVTSSREDVLAIREVAERAREVGRKIVEDYWKAKGYDLECDFDCGSCTDKDVCDGIREIISVRAKKDSAANGGRS